MKTPVLFLAVAFLAPIAPVLSQSLGDYVSAVKGDTLVVKDYYEMNHQPNSLTWVLLLDTVDVPATRVYELKTNGFYPHYYTPRTFPDHPAVIVGADPTIIVNNKNANASPPVICNALAEVFKDPRTYSLMLDGTNLSSGVYFCRLTASDGSQTRKLLLAK